MNFEVCGKPGTLHYYYWYRDERKIVATVFGDEECYCSLSLTRVFNTWINVINVLSLSSIFSTPPVAIPQSHPISGLYTNAPKFVVSISSF